MCMPKWTAGEAIQVTQRQSPRGWSNTGPAFRGSLRPPPVRSPAHPHWSKTFSGSEERPFRGASRRMGPPRRLPHPSRRPASRAPSAVTLKDGSAPPRELWKCIEIAAYQRFLFGTRPTLDLSLGRDRVGDPFEPLGVHEQDGPPRRSEPAKDTGIMLRDPLLQFAACGPGVIAAVRAPQDVQECAIHHRMRSRYGSLAKHTSLAALHASASSFETPASRAPQDEGLQAVVFPKSSGVVTSCTASLGLILRSAPSGARLEGWGRPETSDPMLRTHSS